MDIQLNCPHCQEKFIVNEKDINCAIFRHAVYKNNMQPINPHASLDECTKLLNDNLVYGCAKPFKIIKNETYEAIICDYV